MDRIMEQLRVYRPWNEQEESDCAELLRRLGQGEDLWTRENRSAHLTASGWIVSPERDRALFSFVQRYAQAASPGFRIRLKGLKPHARYRVGDTGLTLSGAALMSAGLPLTPMPGDHGAVQWEIAEV